jgi:rhodanese-related sulfurtransferase
MKASTLLGAFGLVVAVLHVSCETPSAAPPQGAAAPSPAKPTIAVEKPAPPEVKMSGTTPARVDPTTIVTVAPDAPAAKGGTISEMDLGTLFELQGAGRAFLVDVRPAWFYNADHIPGAVSLPLKSFEAVYPTKKADFDAAVSAGKVIVLYCTDEDCPDGRSTARKLAKEGYSTSIYKGGWKEWKASGL